MTNQHHNNHKHDAGITDVLGSMMNLASASTRFTWKQMQNAMGIAVGSQKAMNEVRDSLETISDAMSQNGDSTATHHHHREEAFTGRKT